MLRFGNTCKMIGKWNEETRRLFNEFRWVINSDEIIDSELNGDKIIFVVNVRGAWHKALTEIGFNFLCYVD